MSWGSELPAELLCRPTGLIALSGLDITYNAIHKSIWDAFCNNRRPDRVPLQFIVVQGDHEFPKCRTNKRQSYEWYIPKGILKTNWMRKHLNLVPAVVVIFFDLDWDEPLWKEKQMECATRVEIVRNALQGRGTKVSVVLIQKNAPLPPGEDVVAVERAASLCSLCDLSAKHLYVLPHTDHLVGYTIRLENAFYDLSQSYYHGEAKKVKAHRDFLNKTTHQLLFVRHQFKIAFYNELKQDTHTALKHYKQAYGHLLELRMHDTNLLEIKVNAGFINYKLCRMSFLHNAPLDGIAQFRKHIDFFKSKVGIAELAFEHSAWMSKQFQLFGDLFDEAIKLGLTAIQTQHPGFYYQQAANHSIARKQLCRGFCKPSLKTDETAYLEKMKALDFYGQRYWRPNHQSIDPPDPVKEKEGIAELQNMESRVDHSAIIIPQLNSAVAQFKKYKSPRMKRYLMVQMGEEYYHGKDYQRSLMLLCKVMWDYRGERWWPLLTSILVISLKCAYLTAKVQDYVSNCLELIGPYTKCAAEEKTRIQMNLLRVISNDAPEPEPGLDPACVEKAKVLWSSNSVEPCVFSIEMQSIVPLVECKAKFKADTVPADVEVEIEVFLRIKCPFPMRFYKLSVALNNQIYNQYCEIIDGHGISAASEMESRGGDLYLVPDKPKVFRFSFLPAQDDVGGKIEITDVTLELGTRTARCAQLHWMGPGGDAVIQVQTAQHLLPKKPIYSIEDTLNWDSVEAQGLVRVIPRASLLDVLIEHQQPCLQNEFYVCQLTIINKEDTAISDVRLSIETSESEEEDQTTHLCLDNAVFGGHIVSNISKVSMEELAPGEKSSKTLFIKCLQTGNRNIFIYINYMVEVHKKNQVIPCMCQKKEMFMLNCVEPFEVTVKVMSMKFEATEVVQVDEPFLAMPEIHCTSPWPVEIQDSSIKLTSYVVHTDTFQSQLQGVCLKKTECAAECISLKPLNSIHPTVSLGTYTLHWRRKRENSIAEEPFVSTVFPLPTVSLEQLPISVELRLPAYGSVKTLLPICYTIHNKTPYPQEIEVNVEASDSFMFAGNKQVHFRVLPRKAYNLMYNLFPLMPGHVLLPKMHLNMLRYPGTMDLIVQKSVPTHIFIKPMGKALEKAA
ncbi:hypothetical protein ACJMK2_011491 [Sinanodonta woodiana]|uniref:Trafficking protein particle complex subunit 11 n=1 Tax=Sinanodonta woodiana TaxID=1069815 RepID=A0ABD3V569_SINWO